MVQSIYFIGMSKNCFSNLKKNIEYLLEYEKYSQFNFDICIVDSDSIDGTKEYCRNLVNNKEINSFIEVDNLSEKFSSRIERLMVSRNKGLDYIDDKIKNPALYIPMDMDLDLFSLIEFSKFEKIINDFIHSESDGIFPYSTPYYYDIFALRKKGWVNGNNLLISRNLKKKYILISFLINYFLIFRKQKHIDSFDSKPINVESAFGGMGIYKIYHDTFRYIRYDLNREEIDFYSEHIYFNKNFKKLFISKEWTIESPISYTYFNSYNYIKKFTYILKSLNSDFKNLYLKINKRKNL
jgi:hypothetical protein